MRLGNLIAAAMSLASTRRLAASFGPLGTQSSGYRTIHRLNRSQKWKRARTYSEARALSPFPERPVR
jgi:hypothetical protein